MTEKTRSLPVKLLASTLAAAILVLSPGFDCYRVWAADEVIGAAASESPNVLNMPTMDGQPGAPAALPGAAAPVTLPGASVIGAVELPGAADAKTSDLGSAASNAPAAPQLGSVASQTLPPAVESVAAPVRELGREMNRSSNEDPSAAASVLSRFYENGTGAQGTDSDALPNAGASASNAEASAPAAAQAAASKPPVAVPAVKAQAEPRVWTLGDKLAAAAALAIGVAAFAAGIHGFASLVSGWETQLMDALRHAGDPSMMGLNGVIGANGPSRFSDPGDAYPLALQKAAASAQAAGYKPESLALARAVGERGADGGTWTFEFRAPAAAGAFAAIRIAVRGETASAVTSMPAAAPIDGPSFFSRPISAYAFRVGTRHLTANNALDDAQRAYAGVRGETVTLGLVKDAATGDENLYYVFAAAGRAGVSINAANGILANHGAVPLAATSGPRSPLLSRVTETLAMLGISLMMTGMMLGVPVTLSLVSSYMLAQALGWGLPAAFLAVGLVSAGIVGVTALLAPEEGFNTDKGFFKKHQDLPGFALLAVQFTGVISLFAAAATFAVTVAAPWAAAHALSTGAVLIGGTAAVFLANAVINRPKNARKPLHNNEGGFAVTGLLTAISGVTWIAGLFHHVQNSSIPAPLAAIGIGLSALGGFSLLSSVLKTGKSLVKYGVIGAVVWSLMSNSGLHMDSVTQLFTQAMQWLQSQAHGHLPMAGAAALGLQNIGQGNGDPSQPQKPWLQRNWKIVAGVAAVVVVAAVAAWLFAHVTISWTGTAFLGTSGVYMMGLGLANGTPPVDEVAAFRHALHALHVRVETAMSTDMDARQSARAALDEIRDLETFFNTQPNDPAGKQPIADLEAVLKGVESRVLSMEAASSDGAAFRDSLTALLSGLEKAAASATDRESLLDRVAETMASSAAAHAAVSFVTAAALEKKDRSALAQKLADWGSMLILAACAGMLLTILAMPAALLVGQIFSWSAYSVESAYAVASIWTLGAGLLSALTGTAFAGAAAWMTRR